AERSLALRGAPHPASWSDGPSSRVTRTSPTSRVRVDHGRDEALPRSTCTSNTVDALVSRVDALPERGRCPPGTESTRASNRRETRVSTFDAHPEPGRDEALPMSMRTSYLREPRLEPGR